MRIGSRPTAAALLVSAMFAIATGCGDDDSAVAPVGSPEAGDRSALREREEPNAAQVAPSSCPTGLPSCRTTEGRIVYVERVDPDGDGDAHFVVADAQGITLPGLTAIDVRKGLRPDPLPEVGELISAAGPVQTGSYGQEQIHALELHVAGQ